MLDITKFNCSIYKIKEYRTKFTLQLLHGGCELPLVGKGNGIDESKIENKFFSQETEKDNQ